MAGYLFWSGVLSALWLWNRHEEKAEAAQLEADEAPATQEAA